MKDIITAILAVNVFSALIFVCSGMTAKQVNVTADNLEVRVITATNFDWKQQYKVNILLKNTGKFSILVGSDWEICFTLKCNKLFAQPSFTYMGLEVKPKTGCEYKITPTAGWNSKGLLSMKEIDLQLIFEGLSMFIGEYYPRWIIGNAKGTIAANIRSTDDNSLSFVKLKPANNSGPSQPSTVERFLNMPEVLDAGKVGFPMVCPAPSHITRYDRPRSLAHFNSDLVIVHSSSVSRKTKTTLKNALMKIEAMKGRTVAFTTSESSLTPSQNRIKLILDSSFQGSDDAYNMNIEPKMNTSSQYDAIQMIANSDKGLQNAITTLAGLYGDYHMVPRCKIRDDARLRYRAVEVECTQNFQSVLLLKKLVDVMYMYKMNTLVLNLADDTNYRLQMNPSSDFAEIVDFAGKRCYDSENCLPPAYGSGVNEESFGHYKRSHFKNLLTYAKYYNVLVIPKMNFLGGMRAAKLASQKRFTRLQKTKPKEAERLHLVTPDYPAIPNTGETCYTDGLLDPCKLQTKVFMKEVITDLHEIYKSAGYKEGMPEFHAGGDALTKHLYKFPSCKNKAKDQANILGSTIKHLQSVMGRNGIIRVNDEAVTASPKGTCLSLASQAGKKINPRNLIVDFNSISVPDLESGLNLNPQQIQYLLRPLQMQEGSSMFNATAKDAILPYTGKKMGLAPWGKAYDCANNGYLINFAPKQFYEMAAPRTFNWNQMGASKKFTVNTVTDRSILAVETGNIYMNMDRDESGRRFPAYRMCKMFDCRPLINKQNLVGMQAHIDTKQIRNKDDFFQLILPRLMMFAQGCWHKYPFEGLFKAEQPSTFANESSANIREFTYRTALSDFKNTVGYKELLRLNNLGIYSDLGQLGASIDFGINRLQMPPFDVLTKADWPNSNIEFREITSNRIDNKWKLLYRFDTNERRFRSIFKFDFPQNKNKVQVIEMRIRSADMKRAGLPTTLKYDIKNLIPQTVSAKLRRNTCLPLEHIWATDLTAISFNEWKTILTNVQYFTKDAKDMRALVVRNLTDTMNNYYRVNNIMPQNQKSIAQIEAQIEREIRQGQTQPSPLSAYFVQAVRIVNMQQQQETIQKERTLFEAMKQAYNKDCRGKKHPADKSNMFLNSQTKGNGGQGNNSGQNIRGRNTGSQG